MKLWAQHQERVTVYSPHTVVLAPLTPSPHGTVLKSLSRTCWSCVGVFLNSRCVPLIHSSIWHKQPTRWKKILMLGKTEDERRRRQQRMRRLGSIADSMDMNLSKLQERMEDRGTWHPTVPGVAKSQTWLRDGTATTTGPKPFFLVLVNGNMIHSIAQGRNLRVFFNSSFSPLPQLLNPVHKHRYWFFHPRKTSLRRAYFPIFNTYGLLNIILLKT